MFFSFTERMAGLSFKNPLGEFLFHFGVFFLKFFEFLILEIFFFDDEGLSSVEFLDIERFLFGNGNVGEFKDFLLIDFELINKFLFRDVLWQTFNKEGKIRCSGTLLIDFEFFEFFIILEDRKGNKPNDKHGNTNPALSIVVGVILRGCIELFRPQ